MAEYGDSLSERELEILQLVATGAANKEIAYQLGISANTVKVHLRNIFAKLGAESRTEATMIAVREGWVDVPEVRPTTPDPISQETHKPPLSWFQRVVLLTAGIVAVGAAILSWPHPPSPAASSGEGLLPMGGAAADGPAIDLVGESAWSELAQMPTRRAWLGLATWSQQLYAIGGEGPEGPVNVVEIYDPAGDTWTRGAEKPTAVAHVAAIALDDRIFVPGGCTDSTSALDVLEVYDPARDVWETAAPLPHPICAYAAATHAGKLYLFGGTDGDEYLATTYVYDPASDRWQQRAAMGQARALAAAAFLDGEIYVTGGYRSGRELTACTVYNPAADAWSECAPLTMARGGLGLVGLAGQLYAIGGGGWGGYLGFNERHNPSEDRWIAIETPLTGGWQGTGVTLLDMSIYAVGGYGDDYLSLNLVFDPLPFRVFVPATER